MGMGFYGWIRDGVRRAVLLGVSDAVDQLGVPENSQDVSPHLLAVLRGERAKFESDSPAPAPFAPSRMRSDARRTQPKRLGKSFGDVTRAATPVAAIAKTPVSATAIEPAKPLDSANDLAAAEELRSNVDK